MNHLLSVHTETRGWPVFLKNAEDCPKLLLHLFDHCRCSCVQTMMVYLQSTVQIQSSIILIPVYYNFVLIIKLLVMIPRTQQIRMVEKLPGTNGPPRPPTSYCPLCNMCLNFHPSPPKKKSSEKIFPLACCVSNTSNIPYTVVSLWFCFTNRNITVPRDAPLLLIQLTFPFSSTEGWWMCTGHLCLPWYFCHTDYFSVHNTYPLPDVVDLLLVTDEILVVMRKIR